MKSGVNGVVRGLLLGGFLGMFLFSGAVAQADNHSWKTKYEELKNRLESLEEKQESNSKTLAEELVNLKNEANVSDGKEHYGANKVYHSKEKLSIGGYGELVYLNEQGSLNDTTDVFRFVPYIGYRFSDNIIFNSELEFEHGGVFGKSSTLTDSNGDTVSVKQPSGEIIVEFAYLDFLINEAVNLRLGHVLVPFGLTNIQHEPTMFASVNRPEVEKNIIPTTWHENGLLLHGKFNGGLGEFSYNAGIVNSLDAGSFSDSSWVRGGRQKGSKAKAVNWAGVLNLDWQILQNLNFGASAYDGKSSHGVEALNNAEVFMWELHALYQWKNLRVKALYVEGRLSDSEKVSAATGKTVGKKATGYYAEVQYNIMPLMKPESEKAINLFVRHEDYDPHAEVDGSLTEDKTLHKTRTVVGVNYQPLENVIVKLDYLFRDKENGDENDILEMGIGFVF